MTIDDALARLAEAGFDVIQHFDAGACARELAVEVLADPERPRGLLVGNTRALWPRFLAAREHDAALAAAADPIDRYSERVLEPLVAALDARIVYAHRRYGDAFVPFQRLAVAAGLAALAPTQLLIHPTYGPWFGLRAALLCRGSAPEPAPRVTLPCTCHGTCTDAFARASAATGPDAWRAWLAVRDACPVGRAFRYADDQLAYHYTKDHRHLQ